MISRRHFLEFTGGLTLFPLMSQLSPSTLAQTPPENNIMIQGWDFQGNPLDEKTWNSLYFLDLEDNPHFTPSRTLKNGQLLSYIPPLPVIIGITLPVYGFGQVTLYADNQGKGYNIADFPLNINLELAKTRIYRVETAIKTWRSQGYQLPSSITNRIHKARVYLQNAQNTPNISEQVKWGQASLYESLWGGEEAVLAKARYDINQRGNRPNFLFGCNFFGFPYAGENYENYFAQLFNFATIPLYWRDFEKKQGEKDVERLDLMLNWLEEHQIAAKGHPLVWFAEYGIPNWIEDTRFEVMKEKIATHIEEVTQYFGQRLPYYDIFNEGSGLSFANVPNYSVKELIELTKVASSACSQGNSNAFRIINNCCLWAKYRTREETNPDTPYQYMKACLAANIPFEAIGLQLYYPNHDLLEIDRLLERFGNLGKTIHITELGVPSDDSEDEQSFMKIPFGLWHKPWSETIQADWIEQFYTLCYSKSYIEAITWWDFSDQIRHFWAHGGLLRPDGQPKEAFYRLKNLIQQWKIS